MTQYRLTFIEQDDKVVETVVSAEEIGEACEAMEATGAYLFGCVKLVAR